MIMKQLIILSVVFNLTVAGIALAKTDYHTGLNDQEVNAKSKDHIDPQKREDNLVNQAQSFLKEKEYDHAQRVAEHILENVNSDSQRAKAILKQVEDLKARAAQMNKDTMFHD